MSIESLGPTAGNTANVAENLEEQKAGLDGTSAPELPSTDPKDIIATTERDSEAWLSAREELKKSLPAVVEVMKNPGIQKELEAQSVEPSLEDLVKQLLLNRYPEPADLIAEFETFRKQVIAAFAHLGLDVRKHFGV